MSANEKPKTDRASSLSDKLMAPGDGLRQWWDRLSRIQKWGFGVIGFGLLALLPLFPPPFLNTPNISFGGTMANCAMVPPKLMFGVFRNGGGNNGSSANSPKPMTPKPHFCMRDSRSHH